jgi:nitroimidazol reductase NimA-like FMN-containing flavoprotein (pyridoxamine 5'-phosphate oxidase superfamily)
MDDTREFLRETVANARTSAHLATSRDDRPHVAPVWYTYEERDGEGVFSIMTGGRKLANVRENPRVALSIERAAGSDTLWRVIAFGTAAVVDDRDRTDAAQRAVLEKYEGSVEAADEGGGRLVEVTVGSVDIERY